MTTGRNDLCLELGAVNATARSGTDDLLGDSVHVSTRKLSGHETPMPALRNQGGMAGRLRFDDKIIAMSARGMTVRE